MTKLEIWEGCLAHDELEEVLQELGLPQEPTNNFSIGVSRDDFPRAMAIIDNILDDNDLPEPEEKEFYYNAQKEINAEPMGAVYARPEAESKATSAKSQSKAPDDRAGRTRIVSTMARSKKNSFLSLP